jgi:hypothetical protein
MVLESMLLTAIHDGDVMNMISGGLVPGPYSHIKICGCSNPLYKMKEGVFAYNLIFHAL